MTIRDLVEIGGINIQGNVRIKVFNTYNDEIEFTTYDGFELPFWKVEDDGYADLEILYMYPGTEVIVFELAEGED